MQIPGEKRSRQPDDVGNRAGIFAEAVRDGNMDLAWSMLSKETRGMRMGVWATRNNIDMQVAYKAGYETASIYVRGFSVHCTTPLAIGRLDRPWGSANKLYQRRTRVCVLTFWSNSGSKLSPQTAYDVRANHSNGIRRPRMASRLARLAVF